MISIKLLVIGALVIASSESTKFSTLPICLNADPKATTAYKFQCEDPMTRIFITLVKYSADYKSRCLAPTDAAAAAKNSSSIASISMPTPVNCAAYPTQDLADLCNGKLECIVQLTRHAFKYGFKGANCDFQAQMLTIDYECVPSFFSDPTVPKYNICANKPIDHPILGFIHSPNYPNSYESSKYCQLILRTGENVQRIEIFLIDMELEGLSKRTAALTDYLQVNSKEQLFGEKSFMVIYNDTKDAIVTFRTDVFFNKKGFLLYFKAIKPVDAIVLEEEFETEPVAETTTVKTPPVFIPKGVDTSEENATFGDHKPVESEVKNGSLDGKVKEKSSDASRLSAQSANPPVVHDSITSKAIVGLLAVVALLCLVIVFLVLSNRKKIFRENYSIYKSSLPMDGSQFNDSRIMNPNQLEMGDRLSICNSSALGFVQFHPLPAAQGYKASSSSARTSRDDSMTHLLLNYSGNYIQPIDSPIGKLPLVNVPRQKQAAVNSQEVYEELSQTPYYVAQQLHLQQLIQQKRISISELNAEQIALLKKGALASTNEYCDDSLSSVPNQGLKPNEYCYIPTIPANPASVDVDKARFSLDLAISTDQSLSSDGKCSSNSSLPTDSTTTPPLNLKSMNPKTSTPSLPKTLPPPLTDTFKQAAPASQPDESQTILAEALDESSNEYDVPEAHVPNEYKKCEPSTVEAESSVEQNTVVEEKAPVQDLASPAVALSSQQAAECEYEYQVPSNILAMK